MIIWRSHIKIVGSPGRSRIDLCLNKSVLAMGWSLNDRHLEEHNFSEDEKRKICKQRAAIKSYEDYASLIKEWKVYNAKGKYSLQGTTQGRYLTGGVPPVRFSM